MSRFFKYSLLCLMLFTLTYPVMAVIRHVPIEYATVQAAIDAAAAGDTVLIRPNTYYENIDFKGKNITVGSYIITTGNDAYVYGTIIDGAQKGPVVTFDGGEDSSAVLYGLTIRNGSGKVFNWNTTHVYGGGVYISHASPTIKNNIITGNKSYINTGKCESDGGGIYCDFSKARIVDNVISNNKSYRETDPDVCMSYGGGIFCWYADLLIKGNTISGNTAKFGGGINILSSAATVEDNEIKQNKTYSISIGAGISCLNGFVDSFPPIHIKNNIIKENDGWFGSGICCLETCARIESNLIYDNLYDAIACQQGADTIINNTIYNNYGPALYSSNYANPLLMNNILWGNNHYGEEIRTYAPGEPTITCCLVMGGWPGTGNIDKDPQFCDTTVRDFTLNIYSPCLPCNNSCGVLIGAVDSVACDYMCGDANGDAQLTIEDVMYLLDYYFSDGPALKNDTMADLNHNGHIDLADIVFLAYYVYATGPEPWCAGYSPSAG